MTSQTEKAKTKLSTLCTSFDDLEAQLAPLFEQTLPESIVGLEPIQQAKLQTVLPYLVYDLVFIYLKSRGIDPKTHPVVSELDRVRQYFEKISISEKGPPPKRTEIDKEAAGRFIKRAITQATYGKTPSDTLEPTSTQSTFVKSKITSKILERHQYERELRERDAEESKEDVLGGFEDGDMSMDIDTRNSSAGSREKGKSREVLPTVEEPTAQPNHKRRRPAVDPFAGYGDDAPPAFTLVEEPTPKKSKSIGTSSPPNDTTVSNITKSKSQRGKRRALDETGSLSGTRESTASSNEVVSHPNSPTPGSTKKIKNAKKKSRKSATS